MKIFKQARIAALLILGLGAQAYAQSEMLMPFMTNVAQSTYSNPVARSESKVSIGLPGMSSIYFSGGNNAWTINKIYQLPLQNQNNVIDLSKALSNAPSIHQMHAYSQLDLFSLRIKIKKAFWMFNISERTESDIYVPKGFYQIAFEGNSTNPDLSFKNFAADMTHYREYALGVNSPISDKFILGGRARLLFGKSNVYTQTSNSTLKTDLNSNYALQAQTDMLVNVSSGVVAPKDFGDNFNEQNTRNYLMNSKNIGFAADLGLTYKASPRFEVSAIANNLGFIGWTSQVRNYQGQGSVTFSGVEIDSLTNEQTGFSLESYGDTLASRFSFNETSKKYTSPFKPQALLLANYKLAPNTTLGVGLGARFGKATETSASINLQQRLGRVMNLSVAYAYHHRGLDNLGLGFVFKPGPIQIYVVTDNLLAAFTGANARYANVRTGINFVFGRAEQKDTDLDGTPDKEDNCPDTPGLRNLKGCPDRDKDGISDNEDSCPGDSGLLAFQGCPDRDRDGIADREDKCPDKAGELANKGCPDRDRDGILDNDDLCPDKAGTAELNGCPDQDGDGIGDAQDNCPTQAGTVALKGCPDRDRDGTPDNEDNCPTFAGPKATKGCPDRDRDLVADKDDACPDQAGSPSNKGCPDRDGDGINDAQDKCPTIPGSAALNGCPDQDLDGIPDNADACPTQFGLPENKGCPIVKVKDVYKPLALSTREQNILKEAFKNLEFEAGKSVIKSKSFATLDSLAIVLLSKPDYRLLIEGHTDNMGKPAANVKLSKTRAQSVKNYLVAQGVTAPRFVTNGFGQARPIAKNTTAKGKQRNRRVEMRVIR